MSTGLLLTLFDEVLEGVVLVGVVRGVGRAPAKSGFSCSVGL